MLIFFFIFDHIANFPGRPEEGIGFPKAGVPGGSEPPCGCWEENLSPLQEHPKEHPFSPILSLNKLV